MWHATVDASMDKPVAVVIPAGALVCAMTLNGKAAYGVRKAFLPNSRTCKANLVVAPAL